MRLTDLLAEAGRPVAYYPQLRLLTGSTNATLLLCQLIYWAGKQADSEGWTFKRGRAVEDDREGRLDPDNQSIEHETGLSYKEQMAARRLLRARGLIQERYDRVEHRFYYQVDFKALRLAWQCLIGGQVTDGHVAGDQRSHGMLPVVTSIKGINIDYTQTTSEREASPPAQESPEHDIEEKDSGNMPSTPVEAMRHPDILLYQEVCGRIPGAAQYGVVIETIRYFRAAKGDATVAYLRPYWLAWSARRRRSDGKPYDPRSLTWLTEWAVNGGIPPENGGTHGTHQQGDRKKRRLTTADLAAAKKINRRLGQARLSQMPRGGLPTEDRPAGRTP